MPLHVKQGGAWKGASPSIKAGGNWKQADAWVKASGVWYRATQSGIDVVIDSATTLYDFNLATWLTTNGLNNGTTPVVINTLRVTSRTRITQNVGGNMPDFEARRDNATPWRTARGWGCRVQAGDYGNYSFFYFQENPDLYPAFTTGTLPAGSRINTFIVEGAIYGRGADGVGMPVGYSPLMQTRASDGTVQNSTSPWNFFGAPGGGMTLRHAYPALRLTIPVGRLETPGLIGGGGGSAAVVFAEEYNVAANNYRKSDKPIEEWPELLTQDYLIDYPIKWADPGNTGVRTYQGFGSFTQRMFPIDNLTYGIAGMLFGASGTGGGQGGGQGGGNTSNEIGLMNIGSWDPAPVDGGSGTFDAPGATPAGSWRFTGTDSKSVYWSVQYVSPLTGGRWGEFANLATIKYNSASGTAPPNPPTTQRSVMYSPTIITRTVNSRPTKYRFFRSQPGAAILGSSFLTTNANPTNVKGALK